MIPAIALLIGAWVGMDAYSRRNNAWGWALGSFILAVAVVPVYLSVRNLKAGEGRRGGRGWNVARYFAFSWIAMTLVVAIDSPNLSAAAFLVLAGIGAAGARLLGFFLKDEAVVETGPTGLLSEERPRTLDSALAPAPVPAADSEEPEDQIPDTSSLNDHPEGPDHPTTQHETQPVTARGLVAAPIAENARRAYTSILDRWGAWRGEQLEVDTAPTHPPAPVPRDEAMDNSAESMVRDSMLAKGINGQIEIVGKKIRVTRKGILAFLSQGLSGTKEIMISQISSIQFKTAGKITNGYIQFAFTGGQEAKKGLYQAVSDENSIMFTENQQPAFEIVKAKIDEIRNSLDQAPAIAAPVSQMDELEKLASLRTRGVISEDEFQAKKKQILNL